MWKPFNNTYKEREKPKDKDEQLSQVWDFCYNEFPHWRRFVDLRFNHVWLILGIVIALLGCVIGLGVAG
jgi:hypothetical protein